MTHITTALFAALLALFPTSPARTCLTGRTSEIVEAAERAATRHGVPRGLLLAVAFRETHVGCDRLAYGNWGAVPPRVLPSIADNADYAASSLALGYRSCRTTRGAISNFRCGACTCPRNRGYVDEVLAIAARVYDTADVPPPALLTARR